MKSGKKLAIYPLFWLALAAGLGIVLARHFPQGFLSLFLISIFLLLSALLVKGRFSGFVVLLATVSIFQFYGQTRDYALPLRHLKNFLGEKPGSGEMDVQVLDLPVWKINRSGEPRIEFTGSAESFSNLDGVTPCIGKVKVILRKPGEIKLVPGQTLRIQGFWQRPEPTSNPGQFDYRSYLENQRIYYLVKTEGKSVSEIKASRDPFGLVAFYLREHMLAVLKLGLEEDPETSALMAGMLFGYKEGITTEMEDSFRATGTMHLFAVSGQNVGVILGMLLLVLQSSGLIRWRWAWLLLPLLFIFCLATGMQSSAARAFIMAALILSAWAIYRPTNIFNVLGAAALFLWLREPGEIFDVGFQLSFFVVLGMALGTEPFLAWLYGWGKPDPWIPRRLISRWRSVMDRAYFALCGVLAASLCAWLASQVLVLYYFHLFAPVTLLANIVVMPLAALILSASVLSVAGSFITTAWSMVLNQVNWLSLKFLVAAIELLATLPGGHFYIATPGSTPSPREALFTVFQSSQGAPVLLRNGNENWLVDGGTSYVWQSAINPYRQQLGINRVDGILLTQSGNNHMGSAVEMMAQLPSKSWGEGGYRGKSKIFHQWLESMEKSQVPKRFLRKGDSLSMAGGMEMEILWPPSQRFSERQEDQGVVVRFIKNGTAVLYAGDISSAVEKELVESAVPLRAELLIQGEHSRESNLSKTWIDAIKPRWLVRPERGFHPDGGMGWQKIEELRQSGVEVIRMEESGALQFRIGQSGNSELRSWSSQEKSFK